MAASVTASFDKILSTLKARQYSPIYFLQGEESYFIDEIVNYIDDNVSNNPTGEKGEEIPPLFANAIMPVKKTPEYSK